LKKFIQKEPEKVQIDFGYFTQLTNYFGLWGEMLEGQWWDLWTWKKKPPFFDKLNFDK
jgi:hypothetical protein